MCELCDLRIETEKLQQELHFRFMQFQVELNANQSDAATQCEERVQYIIETMLHNFRKKRLLEVQRDTMDGLHEGVKH